MYDVLLTTNVLYAIIYYYNNISWSPYLEVPVSEDPDDLLLPFRPFESVALAAQHFPRRSCPVRHLKNKNTRELIINITL